jgi:hypothetical protein
MWRYMIIGRLLSGRLLLKSKKSGLQLSSVYIAITMLYVFVAIWGAAAVSN